MFIKHRHTQKMVLAVKMIKNQHLNWLLRDQSHKKGCQISYVEYQTMDNFGRGLQSLSVAIAKTGLVGCHTDNKHQNYLNIIGPFLVLVQNKLCSLLLKLSMFRHMAVTIVQRWKVHIGTSNDPNNLPSIFYGTASMFDDHLRKGPENVLMFFGNFLPTPTIS
jgi:hypothetical protein